MTVRRELGPLGEDFAGEDDHAGFLLQGREWLLEKVCRIFDEMTLSGNFGGKQDKEVLLRETGLNGAVFRCVGH